MTKVVFNCKKPECNNHIRIYFQDSPDPLENKNQIADIIEEAFDVKTTKHNFNHVEYETSGQYYQYEFRCCECNHITRMREHFFAYDDDMKDRRLRDLSAEQILSLISDGKLFSSED